jgi:HK97 family phage major capsid protein
VNREQIEARRAGLASEADIILNRSDGPLADDERTRLTDIEAELEDLKTREKIVDGFAGGASESGDGANPGGLQVIKRADPWAGGDLNRANDRDLVERAKTATERMPGGDKARSAAYDVVAKNGDAVARWALTASQPGYVRAFEKVLRDPYRGHLAWTGEESAAYRDLAALEQRIGSTSDAAGGYAIPTHLDSAFIISAAGASHPYRVISRVVQLAEGGTWNGVTTAGVTASFATEGAEVLDRSPTLARAGIPVHRMHSWVAGSFELIDDAPGLGEEVARLFTDGTDVAEATAFTKGSGTNEPTGIVTALWPETTRRDLHATNSVFTSSDLMAAQQALGARWQSRASWCSSLTYANRVRAFGDSYFEQTVTLDQGVASSLLGRPSYIASDMSTALNTVTNSAFVFGDWSQYVIVDKIGGSRVSFVSHLMGDSNRPTGQAGWYLYKRTGAEPTTTTAFVISSNPGA